MVVEGELINFQNEPLRLFQLSTMSIAEKQRLKKKLKTELDHVQSALQNITEYCKSMASVQSFCNPEQQPSLNGDNHETAMGKKRMAPGVKKRHRDADEFSNKEKAMVREKSEGRSVVRSACKRMTLGTSDDQKEKGGNMDSSKTREYASTFKMPLNHPADRVFNQPGKLLEAKRREKNTVSLPQSVINTTKKEQVLQKKPTTKSLLRRPRTSAEKMKLRKELSNLPARKMPPQLISFPQRKCKLGQVVDAGINVFDKETSWKLHQTIKCCFNARPTEIKKCELQPDQDSHKGDTVLKSGVLDESMSPLACMKSPQRTVERTCSYNEFSKASSVVAEIGLPCDEQLSPTKALRVAKLKTRFADTILKAQQQLGEKSDPANLQQEREKLEKRQQEENAMMRMKAEAEIKIQRQRDREAAWLSLEKTVKTVEIDNSHLSDDLERLGFPQLLNFSMAGDTNFVHASGLQSGLVNPLEQLGLFKKKEDLDEANDFISVASTEDVEEGEITDL